MYYLILKNKYKSGHHAGANPIMLCRKIDIAPPGNSCKLISARRFIKFLAGGLK